MENALFHGDLVNTSRIIYTASDFAKTSLLHIQEIGTLQATKPHTSKRKNLASYLFFFVSSGSGKLYYEKTEYTLSTGSCVFIDTRKSYSHTTSNDLWNLSWIHFDSPTASNIYQKYKERGGTPSFNTPFFQKYIDNFSSLYKIASSSSHTRDMEINTELSALLTLLMAESQVSDNLKSGTKKARAFEIKEYLDENYTKRIALDSLAKRFSINKYYLTRMFKEQFGTSIMDYLLSVRITKAKNLLRFTTMSAEEIGIQAGIGDAYYFSRVFKDVEGINIREFRKQWS